MSRVGAGYLAGYGAIVPFAGAYAEPLRRDLVAERAPAREGGKQRRDLREALEAVGLRGGETISFHHHLRNGDRVLCDTLDVLGEMGLGGFHIAPSSIFAAHAGLVAHIARGTVARISTAFMSGPVAAAIGAGALEMPVRLQTHGGRARGIETGEMVIDLAVMAASMGDAAGNLSGRFGPQAFGAFGYGVVDAARARCTIGVADCLVGALPGAADIGAQQVDHLVVSAIGAAAQIASGTTRITTEPKGLAIAALAADLIAASGAMRDGMGFQTGAGGTSLAVAEMLGQRMAAAGVRGGFASGGITAPLVAMFRAGLFRELWDVQCFDLEAVASLREDASHHGMSASLYASPLRRDAVVNRLDVVILGAAEVDLAFNVNVTTGSDGRILGGSGGHADCAAGAGLTIIVAPLAAGRWPRIVPQVRCITTPGEVVDAVVSEVGIAVHPRRGELRARLVRAGLPVMGLEEMMALGPVAEVQFGGEGRIVALSEYRDGRVLDVLRQVIDGT